MQDFLKVTGMVIGSFPQGEYDRRIVLLTKECGKITAFIKGARRPGSRFCGTTDTFCFGEFDLYVGKNSYTVQNVEISNYFEYFRENLEAAYYGMYFMELADYYTRENGDEALVLLLLYRSLQGLKSEALDNKFVRNIYELKLYAIEGELIPVTSIENVSTVIVSFVNYIVNASIQDLFKVGIKEEYLDELENIVNYQRKHLIDKKLKSLDILELMIK